MLAIRQYEFGGPEVLVPEAVDDLTPGPGQVRIAVAAAGVHVIDTSIRSGRSAGPFPLPDLPMTPGREVAGRVDLLGEGVDPEWSGRRVVAHLGQANGGYAEQAVAPMDALHVVPDGLTDDAAVALIGTGRTTMGVWEVADVVPGDVVIITAAAGGIGSNLVQLAHHVGATVVGLAGGPAKVIQVQALGADIALDYLEVDWPTQVQRTLDGRGGSVLFDSVGGPITADAISLLGDRARVVTFGWSSGDSTPPDEDTLSARSITRTVPIGPAMMQRPGGLRGLEDEAMAAAADGVLAPLVNAPFALVDAASAHRALESRHTIGKVVLTP
ncbi:zinc-binding dehydrogenase [soil metagenome]